MLQHTGQDRRNGEVIDFMRARRSVPAKTMAGPGPDDGEIRLMVEIASRVPDHGKLAPWRFIRYGTKYCEELGRICERRAADMNGALGDEMRGIEGTRVKRAPVVMAVVSRATRHAKIPEWEQVLSAGAAAMNLVIAANALGYDAQWITEWLAFDDAMKPALGLEPEEKIAGFIHIGTRTMAKTERDRPAIEQIFSQFEG